MISIYHSPCGNLLLGESGGKIIFCDWIKDSSTPTLTYSSRRIMRWETIDLSPGDSDILKLVTLQLDEYFSKERKEFVVPVRLIGTPFQQKVWEALSGIPYGATTSYLDIASRIGNPRAVRAVANAIASNPISIIVPCHRVIGSDGSLTGYAGGLEKKEYLLELELRIKNLDI